MNFGDRVVIFGACLLVSVLPLIIVLSAFAGHWIQDDIAQHLGLSAQGDRVVEGLFKPSLTSFDLATFVSLLVSFAGTVAVARSIEVIYERAFGFSPLGQRQGLLRCVVWVLFVGGIVIADSAIGKTLRDGPAGPVVINAVEFVGFALFSGGQSTSYWPAGNRGGGLPGCCRHSALLGRPRSVRRVLLLLDDCFR